MARDRDDDIIKPFVEKNPNDSSTKSVYLVAFQDASNKNKIKYFLTTKLDLTITTLAFPGVEIGPEHSNLKQSELETANSLMKGQDLTYWHLPWDKVCYYRNVSYKKVQ